MCSIPLKECNRKGDCVHPDGPLLPATSEYFPTRSDNGNLRGWCWECSRRYKHKKYWENPEKFRARAREYINRPEIKAKKKAERQTEEYRRANRERARIRWADPEYRAQKRKEYAEREDIRNYRREWHRKNRDRVRKNAQEYRDNNPALIKAIRHRRKARLRNLPNTLTADDWNHALEYFHGRCAVCGRQMDDLFGERTASVDHWIPLVADDCPGTVPENIVPLCVGTDGCNNSKRHKDPYKWLVERYGKRKANQINQRIQEYFASLDSRQPPAVG